MARRKEALDLEYEHERKMLEIRHRFGAPMAKRDQSASTGHSSYAPTHVDVLHPQESTTEGMIRHHDIGPVRETTMEQEPTKPPQALMAMGISRHSSLVPQVPCEPDATGQKHRTAADPSSILDRLLGTPPDPRTQNRPRITLDLDKTPNQHSFEAKHRPRSSSSVSVHIKTSASPVSATARKREAPATAKDNKQDLGKRPWPKVAHLTCYFWKTGKCTKNAEECSYAHYDTGATAMAPESLKRMKKDGSYSRRGIW
ncbi:MAG: hypothetical protein LQ338_001192 [Usnochroma carphineum]|nr:MAG: hypothetical protein LQ338_001192 [Usnochroma carphineum]